jgi:hypothetical protein
MVAPLTETLKLQRPLRDGVLRIVARGGETDDLQRSAAGYIGSS